MRALDRALPQILDDFANGELDNKEAFHVRATQGNQPALNVIGKLDMRRGPDKMVLVTMMRKDDFRTDAFGGGRQKTYEVNISQDLDEMSSMGGVAGGGAVAGYSLPLGAKPKKDLEEKSNEQTKNYKRALA